MTQEEEEIIEMTINRFSKETGGLTGTTENPEASERKGPNKSFPGSFKTTSTF